MREVSRVASASLAPFGHDATSLGNILVRIALERETASAAAVLQALLAFSSPPRYGSHSQAAELKLAALSSFAEGSAATSQWTGYLGGVKTVINASSIKTLLQLGSDVAVLRDWVHYHDVLARFSLLHWKREGAPELLLTPTDLFCSQISNLPPPIFSMLNLLSQGILEVIDLRIRSLPIPKGTDDNDDVSDDATLVMQLYQLAMLWYLNRSPEGLIDQPIRTQQHVDEAFAIFP
ncbi:hypothetical protein DL765_007121 [Monosporascus sp. GIB2]|nr:hypothetical protein DL765_007121 [Monosporascus sp. GIB2]